MCALGLTWHQARLSRHAVSAQAWQGLTGQGTEISKIFIEHPDLRPYFYDEKPIATDDVNRNAVLQLSEMYLDFIESFQDDYVYKLPGMAEDGKYRLQWDLYFRDMFATSPTLCKVAKEKQKWYSTKFDKYAPSESKTTRND